MQKVQFLVSVMQKVQLLVSVMQNSLVVVQSKHSVVEAEEKFHHSFVCKIDFQVFAVVLNQWNEFNSRMTQSNISQSGGSKTPLG